MTEQDLNDLLKQYKIHPVGDGYIDCIASFEDVFNFINDLSDMGI